MSVLLSLLVGATSFLFVQKAGAQVPLYDEAGRTYLHHSWQFDLQTTYYQATANYTKDGGKFDSLPSGYGYQLLDFDMGARWIPLTNWGVYASTRVSNAESKDLITTRRNSSFTQAVLGTDYLMNSSSRKYELIPDFSLTLPMERIDTQSDEVLNREGAIEATARLISRAHWGRFSPFAFIGFTYRDEDRSSLLPYGLGSELQFTGWALGGEIRGYETVIKDKYTNDRIKREVIAPQNGGALHYYAVDPSLLETNIWMRTRFMESWSFKFGGGTSLTGAATSAGWNVFAGLSYSFQPSSSQAPSYPLKKEEDPIRFKEETNDGVNQDLFRPPPPPEPPPEVKTPSKTKAEDPKKKLQKELEQTEFQIELKRPKRRKK